jgi:hypothetical protein
MTWMTVGLENRAVGILKLALLGLWLIGTASGTGGFFTNVLLVGAVVLLGYELVTGRAPA